VKFEIVFSIEASTESQIRIGQIRLPNRSDNTVP